MEIKNINYRKFLFILILKLKTQIMENSYLHNSDGKILTRINMEIKNTNYGKFLLVLI